MSDAKKIPASEYEKARDNPEKKKSTRAVAGFKTPRNGIVVKGTFYFTDDEGNPHKMKDMPETLAFGSNKHKFTPAERAELEELQKAKYKWYNAMTKGEESGRAEAKREYEKANKRWDEIKGAAQERADKGQNAAGKPKSKAEGLIARLPRLLPETKASALKKGDKVNTYADGTCTVDRISKVKDHGTGEPKIRIHCTGSDGKKHVFTVKPDEDSKDW